MYKNILLIYLIFSSCAICLADEIPLCAKPEIPKSPGIRAPQPSITVQCGSNTNNQTVTETPEHNYPTTSAATPQQSSTPANSIYAAIIAGASGVLGVAAGSIASIFVAIRNSKAQVELERMKITANLVAQERLRWLQDIRNRLATLYKTMDMQYSYLKRPIETDGEKKFQEMQDNLSNEIMEQINLITLMLNPNKPDHAKLRNAVQSASKFLYGCFQQKTNVAMTFNDPEYYKLKQQAFDALTEIGITTWGRIQELN